MSLRRRIGDLVDADFDNRAILALVNCHVSTVNRVRAIKRAGGSLSHKKRPGRPAVFTAPRGLRRLRDAIERQPRRSIREHARRFEVSEAAVRKGCRKLGFKSRIRQRRPLLDERMRGLRLVRSRVLLNNLKSAPSGRIIFFSDEKTFTVSEAYNRRNDRYLAKVNDAGDLSVGPSIRYATSTKKPASAMLLGAVASTGEVSPPIWFDGGFRLTGADYVETLRETLVPWMRQVARKHRTTFVWQQDGAPAHTSRAAKDFLRSKVPFWDKEMWPPNSPDLNPLDFSIWNHISRTACAKPHPNVDSLMKAVNSAWTTMSPAYVRRSCKAFRARLQKVIDAKGSIFE